MWDICPTMRPGTQHESGEASKHIESCPILLWVPDNHSEVSGMTTRRTLITGFIPVLQWELHLFLDDRDKTGCLSDFWRTFIANPHSAANAGRRRWDQVEELE